MGDRSASLEVRNPILALPEAQALLASMTPLQRQLFGRLMLAIARVADTKAEQAWKKRKGPMAAYWRACCTYCKHIARAVNRRV